jgi:hypothetical protein
MTKTIKLLAATSFLGATRLFNFAVAATKPDPSVAAKALIIVSGIHGQWQQMPGNIATWRMTGGALLGNGSVGVAIGGAPDQQEFYIGRNDFSGADNAT